MSKTEKTWVLWIGLFITAGALVTLFGIFWYGAVGPATSVPIEYRVPDIVGCLAFAIIGLFMIDSDLRRSKS